MFIVRRYVLNNGQKTQIPQSFGPPLPTREQAEAHLAFVQKTVIGYSSPKVPFQFEVIEESTAPSQTATRSNTGNDSE